MIESLYPLSLASVRPGDSVKRIPTIGAIELALADALREHPCSLLRSVWAAGFSLSPSYIFEACFGINLHDFPFEALALESRIANGTVQSLARQTLLGPSWGEEAFVDSWVVCREIEPQPATAEDLINAVLKASYCSLWDKLDPLGQVWR